jgi:hypothetical protein
MTALRLSVRHTVDHVFAAGLQPEILAPHPHRQLEPAVVFFDAEPDRLLAAFQQVLPPCERPSR